MDGNHFDYPLDMEVEETTASVISIEQLQRLVRLLDQSDVTELELERAAEGVHLALRKFQAGESSQANMGQAAVSAVPAAAKGANADAAEAEKTTHNVVAPLVGTYHVWAKPRGGALVAVGDKVKVGQLVGTIQSLNVLNEVETSVAGRVLELLVQDGQPVEYGQVLMTIDSANGAKGA
ncbi:MAG TPA: biotin/lipoyl-containing protein [Ktedonobacteraceae bacterium]|nr:biotin/lipoyl-containing protein [Ktedonobacteraceae bacterium]